MGDKLKFENITSEFEERDINDNKVLSLFSYLGILVLIPILAAKDSKFAKFHANQGLVIMIAGIALEVINIIVNVIFKYTIYKIVIVGTILSIIVSLIFWILSILLLVLVVYGIVSACQGKAVRFPFVDKLTIIK